MAMLQGAGYLRWQEFSRLRKKEDKWNYEKVKKLFEIREYRNEESGLGNNNADYPF